MNEFLGSKVVPDMLKRMSVSNEDSFETKTLEGIPVLTVYSRSSVTGWTVAIGAPLDELNAGIRRTLTQMLAATLVALGLGLALAWVIGGRIVSAVNRDAERTERANRQFHQVVEATPTAIVMVNQAGVIVMVNTQTEKSFGYSRAELLGQSVDILLPERLRNRHPHHRASFYSDPSPRAMGSGRDLLGRHKNGNEFPVEVGLNPIDTDDGPMVLSTITDISERVSASERQRTSSAYARTLLEASLDPLVTISAQGKITDVNEASVQATGVARGRLIGTDFSDYFTDPDQARTGYEKVFSEGLVRDYPLAIRHTTGRIIDVRYNATVFKDDKGNVVGVFAAARDVTARNLLDKALEETNAELVRTTLVAEKANRAKSDFLSSMSHELRTPLNAILGFAQLLESATPPPTPKQKQSIDHILNGGWHLLELVDEILDLTLIELGKVTLSLEPVSLSEAVLECRAMIEPQARKRGIKLTLSGCETSYFVSADRTRLKQALINLLSNAIKYNRPEGEVAVECRLGPMDSIRIIVRDTGEGLTPEKLAQLFQPFNRLGREAGMEEGTGIGLVVTKRLVELMGGTIGAESTVGIGSVFWIELGLTTAPVLTIEETEHGAPLRRFAVDGTPRRTVLYVEDNPASMELVEQLIARHFDLKLLTVSDGNLGIEFARAYQPDVILMDINLPGISGFDAMKILRADPTTAHIPIIALSANALPSEINTAIQVGFFSYLTKPIRISQFVDALSSVLAKVKA
jgi:PAS domain S-box-containing protein